MKLAKKLPVFVPMLLAGALASGAAQAVPALFDWGFNIDGALTLPGDSLPAAIDTSGFDFTTGLGGISVTIGGVGAHSFDAFFDHEIDEAINTFFNEFGAVSGTAAAGQSWEIDEPGFAFGDIFTNFENSTLDNTNSVPAGLDDDVSMAMGWDFTLAAGETAIIDLILSPFAPASGLQLTHHDPESNETIHFFSTLQVAGTPVGVPEPGVLWLVGAGLVGFTAARRRKG